MPYEVPNQQCDYAMRNPHVPVGFWRAAGLQNAVARECFIDELAVAAGKDPLAFRVAMMKPDDKTASCSRPAPRPRTGARPCLRACSAASPQADGFGSYTAVVVEVSVTRRATSRCIASCRRSTAATS